MNGAVDRGLIHARIPNRVAELGASPTHERFLRLATHYLGAESGVAYTALPNLADSVTIRLRPSKYCIYV